MGSFWFFLIGTVAFGLLGACFLLGAKRIIQALARLGLTWYGNEGPYSWFPKLFDATPFGFLQRKLTRMSSRELMETGADNPGALTIHLWLTRALGVISAAFAAIFVVGAILSVT